MRALVWMSSWEQQCCGEPFAVGGTVTWTAAAPDREWLATVLGPDTVGSVGHAEQHHAGASGALREVSGTVAAIRAVLCRYAEVPENGVRRPVAGSTVLRPKQTADGWEREEDGLTFVGYLIGLDQPGSGDTAG